MEEYVETLKARKQEEKLKTVSLDDWLPITSSRTAKWYYSAFHNVTAMVGAGVLGLPFAMSQLGWGLGTVAIVMSFVITLYTLWQLVEMHEMVPGKRFDRYHELGQHVFGERLGLWIILPLQIIVMVGTDIVYMVTGGQSLRKFHDLVCRQGGCGGDIRLTFWIMIFASPHFVLSQLPNFNSLSAVSGAAAVMSLAYSMIAFSTSVAKGGRAADYGLRATTAPGQAFGMLSALGTVSFAYAAHNVVLEIQATIPSTPEAPSKKPMWRGVVAAYAVVALCYFSVAFAGYYAFGSSVDPNVLITLDRPRWLIAAANLMVVVHVIGGYQVFAMPMFDMIETVLVKRHGFAPGFWLRFVSRSAYVAATMFVGLTFPFFDGLLGFFGGFGFAPTTYFIPCIMWLVVRKPKKYGLSWFINIICIVIGVLLTLIASIGGLRQIILDAKSYKLYS
ncbi:lysine histidine transporter 2 [Zea mays]|uniref:Lysine histidine transporter-like 5 n=2 Tax=Zea mays TaxID=4577 RepID=A0A1D6M0I0_MAIZE|nr:lysine histidine transporter 2 [Zea mays]AQK84811.1 Lysine histidine transporter-like 5 [Zea mays]|eukprot:XP_008649457.1 lysine histidine transporter 2 [Zea mays]